MVFINDSTVIGAVLSYFTSHLAGSLFLAVMVIVIILMFFGFAFRIPMEFQVVYILPLLIGLMAYSSEFLTVGGVAILYLAVVFAKMFFLRV